MLLLYPTVVGLLPSMMDAAAVWCGTAMASVVITETGEVTVGVTASVMETAEMNMMIVVFTVSITAMESVQNDLALCRNGHS